MTSEQQRKYLFILVFSRFEYSLKARNYLIDKVDGANARPDWATLRNALPDWTDRQCLEAVRFLTSQNSKPLTQKVENGLPKYLPKQLQGSNPFQQAVDAVIQVRNNLFHGGKSDEITKEFIRSDTLIMHSLAILKRLLNGLRQSADHKLVSVTSCFTEMAILEGAMDDNAIIEDWLYS